MGYDAPLNSTDEDLLNCRAVAREVVRIALESPRAWSVRIGIYAEWGAGKTTAMNFAQGDLERQGHLTTNFNPWHHSSEAGLMRSLFVAVAKRLEAAKLLTSKDRFVSATSEYGDSFFDFLNESGLKGIDSRATIAVGVIDKVRGLFNPREETWARIVRDLGERRLIVFVDDLDRADPDLVPRVLLVLREVLDKLPIVFVLALDPAIVGAALRKHHPGFGGLEFLEKIVDFPIRLPIPSESQLGRVLDSELLQLGPRVPASVVDVWRRHLPRNPRKIKQMVRTLWTRMALVRRLDADEIQWEILFGLLIIRNRWSRVFELMRDEPQHIEGIAENLFLASDERVQARRREAVAGLVRRALGEAGDEEAMSCVDALGRAGLYGGEESIRIHLAYLEADPLLTTGEARRIASEVAAAQPGDRWGAIVDRCRSHLETQHGEMTELVRSLFLETVHEYERDLDRIANLHLEEEMGDALAGARGKLAVLSAIALGPMGFAGCPSALTVEDYRGLHGAITRYAHFTNSRRYAEVRAEEAALMNSATAAIASSPERHLAAIDFEGSAVMAEKREALEKLNAEVRAVLEEKVRERWVAVLSLPGGIGLLKGEWQYKAERLLYDTARMWTEPRVRELRDVAERARSSPKEHRNLFEMFILLCRSGESEVPVFAEVLRVIWSGLVVAPLNPRTRGTLDGMRAALKERTGIELEPEPEPIGAADPGAAPKGG